MRRRVSRLLPVAIGLPFITFGVCASLHAQRSHSVPAIGVPSHPHVSLPAAQHPAMPMRPGLQVQNHHQNQHRPTEGNSRPGGDRHGGAGYQARAPYPYVYTGYPWLFPFGYGLPYGDDSSPVSDSSAQAPPQAPDFSNDPSPANPPEVAANEASSYRPPYQRPPVDVPVNPQPATTLVFNDGRPSLQVHNYALLGNTLYALDAEARQDIPLSDLNLAATIAANRKTGVDFSIPSSH